MCCGAKPSNAGRALDVLNRPDRGTLDEALDGAVLVRHRDDAARLSPRCTPALCAVARQRGWRGNSSAKYEGDGVLFGSERFGMQNSVCHRCHACLSIPTDRRSAR
jgi:tRNA C32,U32 (ribose-2'-O)-methylase TrmJ